MPPKGSEGFYAGRVLEGFYAADGSMQSAPGMPPAGGPPAAPMPGMPGMPGGMPPAAPAAPMAGGSMVKKTAEKVKVMGRERCVYIDCKRHKLVKVKGTYVRLTDARAATKSPKKK